MMMTMMMVHGDDYLDNDYDDGDDDDSGDDDDHIWKLSTIGLKQSRGHQCH